MKKPKYSEYLEKYGSYGMDPHYISALQSYIDYLESINETQRAENIRLIKVLDHILERLKDINKSRRKVKI